MFCGGVVCGSALLWPLQCHSLVGAAAFNYSPFYLFIYWCKLIYEIKTFIFEYFKEINKPVLVINTLEWGHD